MHFLSPAPPSRRAVGVLGLLFVLMCSIVGPAGAADRVEAPIDVRLTHADGSPSWIVGELAIVDLPDLSSDPRSSREFAEVLLTAARDVAARHLVASGTEELSIDLLRVDESGIAHVAVAQSHGGLPIIASGFRFRVDLADGRMTSWNGRFHPNPELSVEASMSGDKALSRALETLGGEAEVLSKPELIFFARSGSPKLAYRVRVFALGEIGPSMLVIDAHDGSILDHLPEVLTATPVSTPTATPIPAPQNVEFATWDWGWPDVSCSTMVSFPMPGFLTVPSTPCSADPAVSRGHQWAMDSYRYFKSQHGWTEFGNSLPKMKSVVNHWQPTDWGVWLPSYNNAFYNAEYHYVGYGTGDGQSYSDFTMGFDIGVHEHTHAVANAMKVGSYGSGDPGAVNEAIADILAAAAEVWADGFKTGDTYLFGEDVTLQHPLGYLRNMADPAADPNAADYFPTRKFQNCPLPKQSNDYCGVHVNAGIANLAFYLMAEGGAHPRRPRAGTVKGVGFDHAVEIFWRAFQYTNSWDGFEPLRAATELAASELYGPADVAAVSKAWDLVGVP